jgi:hypothetical protein
MPPTKEKFFLLSLEKHCKKPFLVRFKEWVTIQKGGDWKQ